MCGLSPVVAAYFAFVMTESTLLTELLALTAERTPQALALTSGASSLAYGDLSAGVGQFASGLLGLGLGRGERVAIYLEKRFETVIASFGAPAAGAVFVPVNPLLKPEQVAYILRDCNVRVLVTSPERFALMQDVLTECPDLRHVVVTDSAANLDQAGVNPNRSVTETPAGSLALTYWRDLLSSPPRPGHRVIDTDMAAILYTSGSTGRPKGVVLSHRNMVAGAKSVASYLENHPHDTLLAALPLSFVVVPIRDEQAIIDRLEYLRSHPEERKEMGKRARERALQYTWETYSTTALARVQEIFWPR